MKRAVLTQGELAGRLLSVAPGFSFRHVAILQFLFLIVLLGRTSASVRHMCLCREPVLMMISKAKNSAMVDGQKNQCQSKQCQLKQLQKNCGCTVTAPFKKTSDYEYVQLEPDSDCSDGEDRDIENGSYQTVQGARYTVHGVMELVPKDTLSEHYRSAMYGTRVNSTSRVSTRRISTSGTSTNGTSISETSISGNSISGTGPVEPAPEKTPSVEPDQWNQHHM
jgi:hypothetical protein